MAKKSKKADKKELALEDVLLALQKSFSRVSNESGKVAAQNARALITGPVNFELNIRLAPRKQYLAHKADGDLQLKLVGTLHPDIRVTHKDDSQQPVNEP
ncbi:MAG: hypothetical protein HC841_06575 [Verrucomicrobiae bacterium]|nr:hypothetical protein [Verrucomicrobiae bacterium]